MPRGDRTGPGGMGPGTGRGMGFCSGFDAPGFAHKGYGRGFGGGRGGFGRGRGFGGGFASGGFAGGGPGRGFGRGFGGYAAWGDGYRYAPGPDEEKEYLDREIAGMKDHIKGLEERRAELDGGE